MIAWPTDTPIGDYTVITPYLIPDRSTKKVNVGDGFIMDSCVKLIGAQPKAMFSSRARLTEATIAAINASRCVIVMGANTLKDAFEITPGFDAATLRQITVPVILMGLGHYGTAEHTQGLSPGSVALLEEILERFPYMSVRCDESRRYVAAGIPHRRDQILMTSCPVIYPVDGIDDDFALKAAYDQVVVTITDRADLSSQMPLLDLARAAFPAQRYVLALHQDYANEPLWQIAAAKGYDVFRSDDFQDFIALYRDTDLHVGNRVHGHLKCLSMGKRSFLTPFDLRHVYFAQSLGFTLADMSRLDGMKDQRFDEPRAAVSRAQGAMTRFVSAIRSTLA